MNMFLRLLILKKNLISLFFEKNIFTVYKFKYKTSSIYNTLFIYVQICISMYMHKLYICINIYINIYLCINYYLYIIELNILYY